MQLRCMFKMFFRKEGIIPKTSNHLRHQLIDIVNDDDILFHWSMLAVNLDIAEQWVTV